MAFNYLDSQPLLHKLLDLGYIQVECHKATLPTLPEQHVRLHNQFGGRQPWMLVHKLRKVRRLCDLSVNNLQDQISQTNLVRYQI